MAEQTVVFSDLSGEAIEPGRRATITIRFEDARRGGYVLDVTEAEAHELGQKGRRQGRSHSSKKRRTTNRP